MSLNRIEPLDNPLWHALTTSHAGLALRAGAAARYPGSVAPFLAVESADADAAGGFDQLFAVGEHGYFLSTKPGLGPDWQVGPETGVLQMVCQQLPESAAATEFIELGLEHRDDMLALTALVFPGFFRARTLEMGRYIGIYRDGQLAAMAGERMRLTGYQEISAVCTHPDHQGQGLAHALVARISVDCAARGLRPFLHVYPGNRRARSVYERLGFADRTHLPLWSVTRSS